VLHRDGARRRPIAWQSRADHPNGEWRLSVAVLHAARSEAGIAGGESGYFASPIGKRRAACGCGDGPPATPT